LKLQSVKIGGIPARNAHFEAPTCLVSILWFSSAVAVSTGKLQNLSSRRFPIVFSVAGVALFDTMSKVLLFGRRSTFASLSEDKLHFSWRAQHFGHRHFA